MKTWTITGDFGAAEVTIDERGMVAEADRPLHDLVGYPWGHARRFCIAQGWHGDRYPAFIRGKSGLKRRGWTEKQINLYLPEPDSNEPNPHHPGGLPMNLYCIRRVEALEAQWGLDVQQQTA